MSTTKVKKKPRKAKARSPLILMATRNLINMVVVGTTAGAILFALLAAKHL